MFFFLTATPILAGRRYIIEGKVENVAYSISSSWKCYIAVNSHGDENSLKFHSCRDLEMCKYAAKMKETKLHVRMVAENLDGESHTTILIMDGGTLATFYIDVLGEHIKDNRSPKQKFFF